MTLKTLFNFVSVPPVSLQNQISEFPFSAVLLLKLQLTDKINYRLTLGRNSLFIPTEEGNGIEDLHLGLSRIFFKASPLEILKMTFRIFKFKVTVFSVLLPMSQSLFHESLYIFFQCVFKELCA